MESVIVGMRGFLRMKEGYPVMDILSGNTLTGEVRLVPEGTGYSLIEDNEPGAIWYLTRVTLPQTKHPTWMDIVEDQDFTLSHIGASGQGAWGEKDVYEIMYVPT